MRVLVFGDSITQGMWDSRGGWVQRIRSYYDQKHVQTWGDDPEIINVGISGDRIDDVLLRLPAEVAARKWFDEPFGLVLAIGINDVALENDNEIKDLPRFAKQYIDLLKMAHKMTKTVLVIGLTLVDEASPVASDPKYRYANDRIIEFDDAIKTICADEKIDYVSLRAIGQQSGMLSDGLHPNDAGHSWIAETIMPAFESKFTQTP